MCETTASPATLETLILIPPIFLQIFENLKFDEALAIRFTSRTFYATIRANLLLPADGAVTMMLPTQHIWSKHRVGRHRSSSVLDFGDCYWLEDEHLREAVMPQAAHLRQLYLDHCWNLSNRALAQLLPQCGHLTKLSLANIYSIEDGLLQIISSHCRHIHWICLRECWRITDRGILMLLGGDEQASERLAPAACRCESNNGVNNIGNDGHGMIEGDGRLGSLIEYLDLRRCSQVSTDLVATLLTAHRTRHIAIVHDKMQLLSTSDVL